LKGLLMIGSGRIAGDDHDINASVGGLNKALSVLRAYPRAANEDETCLGGE